jgi:glycolate oxidase subunit GlcD
MEQRNMAAAFSVFPGIDLQPGALLARLAAHLTIEQVNAHLRAHGLWLPIVPLKRGQTLADLVAQNAGGRYALRSGSIVRYVRAATVQGEPAGTGNPSRLLLGGPTIKRATGYRLPQSLVGGGNAHLQRLLDLTVSLRPLPSARRVVLLRGSSLPGVVAFARTLMQAGLSLSALAVSGRFSGHHQNDPAPDALLLVGLEGVPSAVARQEAHLETLVMQAGASLSLSLVERDDDGGLHPSACWQAWEECEERAELAPPPSLAWSLPSPDVPGLLHQAGKVAHRYGVCLSLWGDAGTGTLRGRIEMGSENAPRTPGEVQQAAVVLVSLSRGTGRTTTRTARTTTVRGAGRSDLPPLPRIAGIIPAPPPLAEPLHPDGAPLHPLAASLAPELQRVVGAAWVRTRPEELACYETDASIARASGSPLAVVLPGSTAEVREVMQLAHEAGVPVVTRGAGSGLAGGATPSAGALLLVLTRMQQIEVDTGRRAAQVEAGAATTAVQRAAEARGLFYPPDPSSQPVSTIGGNIACNAGGPRCLKYGVTADYVLALTVVLADGRVVRVGEENTGLMHLLIGSEGTLAVVTEATLRLVPQPAARQTAMASFARLDDACKAVEAIIAAGVVPAALELMDDTTIRVVENGMGLGLPRDVEALLLVQVDGDPEAVAWEQHTLTELLRRSGSRTVQVARTADEEAVLWKARRSISPALARVCPHKLGEDICVPVPQVAAAVRRIKAIAAQYEVLIPVFGHAGDGNLHPNILFDARDPALAARAWQAAEAIFAAALDLGGTLSGEHGIGTLKRSFLAAALGDEVLSLHRAVKVAFDPQLRLNPGKMLPRERERGQE